MLTLFHNTDGQVMSGPICVVWIMSYCFYNLSLPIPIWITSYITQNDFCHPSLSFCESQSKVNAVWTYEANTRVRRKGSLC